ncbi:MAG: NAD(+)/NADH kinase [Thermoleophilaceae bacterium]
MTAPRTVTLFSRNAADSTQPAVAQLAEAAAAVGVELRVPPEEAEKHGETLAGRDGSGVVLGADLDQPTDLVIALGGDGTILSALRAFAGRGVPVFAINYGMIGFLSSVENSEIADGLRRALAGEYEIVPLPALTVEAAGGEHLAVNDVSLHRHPEGRVAELGYSVRGERLGEVRADGLVVATPTGSTGYNLANGGPVMAWGVEGFVVSFIAPHTLTARALVVAPDDVLEVENRSSVESVQLTTDGRNVGELEPDERARVRFEHDRASLAQIPGESFYHRLRDKFGRLSH